MTDNTVTGAQSAGKTTRSRHCPAEPNVEPPELRPAGPGSGTPEVRS